MTDRKALNPLLRWLWDLLSFYSVEEIRVPTEYHEQVVSIKELLRSDTSGLINSIMDFSINCAQVEFNVESDSEPVAELMENWFDSINMSLLGRVPTGLTALSKQYYQERWKNSSFIVLRTIWENVTIEGTTFNMPTKMWFVDGANLVCVDDSESRIIGNEKYYIKIDDKQKKVLPASKEELIFVQKPFSSWSDIYPTPFLIQRGVWKNLMFFNLINKKGEKLVGKALEYLLLMKKGTEGLALHGNADYTYSKDDLEKAKDDLKGMLQDNKTDPGTPLYATNFDTSLEHIMPDYNKVFNKELYIPLERRILAGLGLIEIVEGVASTRRESILNPRPFIAEIQGGVKDFSCLMSDVMQEIKNRNEKNHPKYFGKEIELHYTPIKEFVSDSLRDHFRSMYDRGVLSRETYLEVVGDVDLDIEYTRRKTETDRDMNIVMYPPIVDNREGTGADFPEDGKPPKLKVLTPKPKTPAVPGVPVAAPNAKETVPVAKKSVEKKNFKGEVADKIIGEPTDPRVEKGQVVKEAKGYYVISEEGKTLSGPYKTKREANKNV